MSLSTIVKIYESAVVEVFSVLSSEVRRKFAKGSKGRQDRLRRGCRCEGRQNVKDLSRFTTGSPLVHQELVIREILRDTEKEQARDRSPC